MGGQLVGNLDARVGRALLTDQIKQRPCIVRVQADASMRSWRAKSADFSGAVNGIAAVKEDRVGHRCVIIAL